MYRIVSLFSSSVRMLSHILLTLFGSGFFSSLQGQAPISIIKVIAICTCALLADD